MAGSAGWRAHQSRVEDYNLLDYLLGLLLPAPASQPACLFLGLEKGVAHAFSFRRKREGNLQYRNRTNLQL